MFNTEPVPARSARSVNADGEMTRHRCRCPVILSAAYWPAALSVGIAVVAVLRCCAEQMMRVEDSRLPFLAQPVALATDLEHMAVAQHRPTHGTVLVNGLPEANDLDLVLSQLAQPLQNLGQRPAQSSSATTFTQSPGWRAAFKRFSPAGSKRSRSPRPRRPGRRRPVPGAGSPGCWRLRRWLPAHGRIHRVFRSSSAGTRFWHGGMKLRLAEFRLCSNSSLYDRACRADGPDLRAV